MERVEFEGLDVIPDRWKLDSDDDRIWLAFLVNLDPGQHHQFERVLQQRAADEAEQYFPVEMVGITTGPLFRASINGRGGQLSYDAAHNRWKKYCAVAGTGIGIHQLRHAHATGSEVSGVASAASFGSLCECRGAGLRGQRGAGGEGAWAGRHAG